MLWLCWKMSHETWCVFTGLYQTCDNTGLQPRLFSVLLVIFFSESLWSDSLLYSFKRGTRIWTCGGLRKAKTISAMQAWNPEGAWVLALLPVHLPRSGTHEVCTRLHIPAPGAASAELIFLAEQQAESKLINHVQLIRLAFLCVSRERNGGAGEKTSAVQPALEKAVNMEFMQILLFILFLDTPASVPQCL